MKSLLFLIVVFFFSVVVSFSQDIIHIPANYKAMQDPQWTLEIMATNLDGAWIKIGNFDNDNDNDFVIQNGDTLFWYENLQPGWTQHIIDTQFVNSTYGGVFVIDLDQDGDVDVFQYSTFNPGVIAWNENSLNGTQWFRHIICDPINFPGNILGNGFDDLDGDGDLDFAITSVGDGTIYWFENITGATTWERHNIANLNEATWTTLSDIDGDNDPDIIGAAYQSGKISWYENALPDTNWTAHQIATLSGTYKGLGSDLDEDGDVDIVTQSNSSNVLVWYENPSWDEHIIISGLPNLDLGPVGDIDQDGDPDVTYGSQNNLGWCKNLGFASNWEILIIDTVTDHYPYPNDLGDINGDGAKDISAYTIDLALWIADARWYANPYAIIRVPEDYSTIQEGINAANNGNIVLVDDGVYTENINFRGKAITVASHFIIDGDTNHISNTIIDGSQPSNPDSASVVTFESGEDTTSILCGFTITGGTGTLSHLTQSTRRGGGVLCYQSGARIEYNIIENNECVHQLYAYGGGVCEMNVSGDPHFSYVIVENNKIRNNRCESSEAQSAGGGIFFRGEGRIIYNNIINNEVEYNGASGNNLTSFGGGIECNWWDAGYAYVKIYYNFIANNRALSNNPLAGGYCGGVDLEVVICDFRGNTVKDNRVSGAPFAFGGGMRVQLSLHSVITENSFINNGPMDASVMVIGGGLLTEQTENLTIENNEFLLNNGQYGGGIYLSEDTVVSVRNNKFLQNNAINSGGGALITDGSNSLFENNLVAGNTAWSGGGVVVLSASKKNYNDSRINSLIMMSGGLGEITAENNVTTTLPSQLKKTTSLISEPLLINNTIVDNSANTLGGGIFNENSHLTILNTILWGNTAAQDSQIYVFNGDVFVEYSDVQGGWSGEGNIDEEPLFIIGDTLFHLSDSSPCVNTGADSLYYSGQWYFCPPDDYEGDERPYMGRDADIGADESQVPPVGIKSETSGIPQSYELRQNYPNPFNPITTISYRIPELSFVTLKVYDVLGNEVATLVNEEKPVGSYELTWGSASLPSGIYFYQLRACNYSETKKMILLK
jgi:hypothetical protein